MYSKLGVLIGDGDKHSTIDGRKSPTVIRIFHSRGQNLNHYTPYPNLQCVHGRCYFPISIFGIHRMQASRILAPTGQSAFEPFKIAGSVQPQTPCEIRALGLQ